MDQQKFNLKLAASREDADLINKKFYSRFSYPAPPMTFEAFSEDRFGVTMLNQDLGCWSHDLVPETPNIWVAGCGTNQAVYTALRFPRGRVLGTDLSDESLEISRNAADQLGIENLRLEEHSINLARYEDEFDYVICTGVIHHNADPAESLSKIAKALKPDGVLELMVYNYYHRVLSTAFQQAIRILSGADSAVDFDLELPLAQKLIENLPAQNLMTEFLRGSELTNENEAELADLLLQPIEYSYTVETLKELAGRCGLEYRLPCVNHFDKIGGRLSWNMRFADPEIRARYEQLPDSRRWQVTNLLMCNQSPMLWFYLQRSDAANRKKSEAEVCQDFLESRFERYELRKKVYRRDHQGRYARSPRIVPFPVPSAPADELARGIFKTLKPRAAMKDVFRNLGIGTSFSDVHRARICLTTTAFPYLRAVS